MRSDNWCAYPWNPRRNSGSSRRPPTGWMLSRRQEWQPDIILLDLHMPVMGGLEALPKLVLASPRSSIIVMSDSDEADVESAVLERGAAGFIPKAADPNQLPAAITEVLDASVAPVMIPRPRILVVGYDAQTRDAITDGLADQLNALVVDSPGADDALEKLRTAPFDLIVCGNHMQDMDGPAFLENAKALARGTPRIMFARPHDPSIEAQAREAGAALFVSRERAAPERSIRELAQKTRRLSFAVALSRHRQLHGTGHR